MLTLLEPLCFGNEICLIRDVLGWEVDGQWKSWKVCWRVLMQQGQSKKASIIFECVSCCLQLFEMNEVFDSSELSDTVESSCDYAGWLKHVNHGVFQCNRLKALAVSYVLLLWVGRVRDKPVEWEIASRVIFTNHARCCVCEVCMLTHKLSRVVMVICSLVLCD